MSWNVLEYLNIPSPFKHPPIFLEYTGIKILFKKTNKFFPQPDVLLSFKLLDIKQLPYAQNSTGDTKNLQTSFLLLEKKELILFSFLATDSSRSYSVMICAIK